jgi:hypothetical protein
MFIVLVCESYPRVFIVPMSVSDNQMRVVASFRSKGRVPVLTWLHPKTGTCACACACAPTTTHTAHKPHAHPHTHTQHTPYMQSVVYVLITHLLL